MLYFNSYVICNSFVNLCHRILQGETQWVLIRFDREVLASELKLQFQGGFSSRTVEVQFLTDGNCMKSEVVNPIDSNSGQSFTFPPTAANSFKFTFSEAVDFFGRIILYDIDIIGTL